MKGWKWIALNYQILSPNRTSDQFKPMHTMMCKPWRFLCMKKPEFSASVTVKSLAIPIIALPFVSRSEWGQAKIYLGRYWIKRGGRNRGDEARCEVIPVYANRISTLSFLFPIQRFVEVLKWAWRSLFQSPLPGSLALWARSCTVVLRVWTHINKGLSPISPGLLSSSCELNPMEELFPHGSLGRL